MASAAFYLFAIPNDTRSPIRKDIVIKLSQRRKISCIEVVSLLEMTVSPTSVDNVVATLRIDIVATLCQLCKAVTLKSALQRFFNFASTSLQLIF